MSAKVTEAHREMARALWDEGGWAGPPPKAREWLALALADAEAGEREAIAYDVNTFSEMHSLNLRELVDGIRARGQS